MPIPETPQRLTPAWLEEVLQAPVTSVRATLIGEGYGLDGTVARLDLSPAATLVAKFAKAKRGQTEIDFYERIAPGMPIRLPRFFGGRVDEDADRAIFLLEHIAPAVQGDVLIGADRTQASAIAGAMARFHAKFHWADDPLLADLTVWTAGADSIVGLVEERLERFERRHMDGLSPRERVLVQALPALLLEAKGHLGEAVPTLIHDDLHLDNVLFPSPDEPVILDWPEARRGPSAMDFVRLLVEGMTADSRRRYEEEVGEVYRAVRAAAGEALPPPDEWRRQTRAAFIWHLAYAVAWAGAENPGYDTPRVREIVASLVRNAAAAAADHVTPSSP